MARLFDAYNKRNFKINKFDDGEAYVLWSEDLDQITLRESELHLLLEAIELGVEPMEQAKAAPRVEVKLKWLNESGHFSEYCTKYGMNPWAMNEGLADGDDTTMITLEEFQAWFPNGITN